MPQQIDTADECMESIRQVWLAAPKEAAASMANALNDIVHSIFGEPERIGYELLQNADDAAIHPGLSVDIRFLLLKEFLVVRHNGRHFTPDNVRALCRYGAADHETSTAGENEKQLDLQKIGYKGIGFKSVFNIADRVWVISGDFSFRFDKLHWNGRPMPWQIVPVPSPRETLPPAVAAATDPQEVNFVLEIKQDLDRMTIRKRLASLFKHENIILFLRHARCLELLYEDPAGTLKSFRKLVRSSQPPVFTLERHDDNEPKELTRWHVTTFQVPVPPETRASLLPMDKRLCPEKLKTATEIDISFAAKLREDHSVVPLDKPLIYSYLPTGQRYKFPFLVNSNFLMNEARTSLLGGQWNGFLFEQIGYHQFHWFRQMADSHQFRYEFAGLMVRYADNNTEALNQCLNDGVRRAQDEVAFVPVLQSEELKKAPHTIVDKTRVSDELQEHELVRECFGEARHGIADPRIKRIDRLLSVGALEFDPQQLRDAIRRGRRFTSVQDNLRLLRFFHGKTSEDTAGEWLQVLHETPFLLDRSGALREPRELYFPSETPELPFDLPLSFLHEALFEGAVAGNAALRDWLGKLGMAFPRPLEIIRRGVFPMIENGQVGQGNALVVGRYVFMHQAGLSSEDFRKLAHLPLLTARNSLRKAAFCFLSDAFEPRLPMEDLLDEDIYVSKEYLAEGEAPLAWNRFFSKIGVRQDMELVLEEGYFPFNHELRARHGEYLDFLAPHLPPFNKSAAHSLHTFLTPRYLSYAARHDFSMKYWRLLLDEKWGELLQKSSQARFVHSNGRSSIPSYFQFLVQTRPLFPAEGGHCHPTAAVCSASLSRLVCDELPVSAFKLTPQQEKFLGIRTELTAEDCLAILDGMARQPERLDKGRVLALYEYMLARRFLPEELQAGDGFRLLAANNSFQPAGKLLHLDVPRFAEKSDSPHFVFLDLQQEQAMAFCRLFGIRVVGTEDLELAHDGYQGHIQPNEFPLDWQLKLPFIAVVAAVRKGRPQEEELGRLVSLSGRITFRPCAALQLTCQKEGELIYRRKVQAWQSGDEIYYLHDWQDARTLYDLQEVLASAFGLEGCERELGLLLSIRADNIPEWLSGQGYPLPGETAAAPALPPADKKAPPPQLQPAVKTTPQAAATTKPATIRPQAPASRPAAGAISEEDAGAIGRWGEEYVRDKALIEGYYRSLGVAPARLEWVNEAGESGLPFDFRVVLNNGGTDYWEVKSTPSPSLAEYPVSGKEFQHALLNEGHYFIIRILSAGTPQPDCKILEEPLQLVREGLIRLKGLRMVLLTE